MNPRAFLLLVVAIEDVCELSLLLEVLFMSDMAPMGFSYWFFTSPLVCFYLLHAYVSLVCKTAIYLPKYLFSSLDLRNACKSQHCEIVILLFLINKGGEMQEGWKRRTLCFKPKLSILPLMLWSRLAAMQLKTQLLKQVPLGKVTCIYLQVFATGDVITVTFF